MKIPNFRLSLIYLFLTLVFASCQDDKTVPEGATELTYVPNELALSNFIKPPFLDRGVEQEIYSINTDKDQEIITESGSKIKIKKNIFVDEEGKIVSGKVNIEYRDFHNPIEIFLSGIPMEYDSSGVKSIFETAGMFELRAYQNDKPLGIKYGEEVEMNLVSTSSEKDFNFYSFNESTGNWIYEDKTMDIVVESKIEKKKKAGKLAKPLLQNESLYSFEMDVENEEYPELETYEGTVFEVLKATSFDPLYYNVQWDNVEVEKKSGNYVIELFKEDTSIVVAVKPVVKKGMFHKAKKKYQEEKAALENPSPGQNEFDLYGSKSIAYNSEASAQSEVVRQFTINGFGIFNCDKPGITMPQARIQELIVMNNGKEIKLGGKVSFYVVDITKNALVSLSSTPKYYRNKPSILWTILGDDMVILTPSQLESVPENDKLITGIYSIEEGLDLLAKLM